MDIEELKRNMENFVGKRVLVVGEDHPHKGERGVTKRVEIVQATGKPGMVVLGDNGEEFFVFNGTDLFFIVMSLEV